MYAINGVALDDETKGWRVLRAGTSTKGGITNTLNRVPVPGRPGYTPAPSTFTEQLLIFNVRTPLDSLEELMTLAAGASVVTREDDPSREAYVELASAIPSSQFPRDELVDVTITLVVFQGVWRDASAVVFGPEDITSPSQTVTLFGGLSAPVYDMDVFVRGVFGEFVLTDSGGSFLKTTGAWAGTSSTGLLFVGSTGQAFLANESNPWVPVSDASQAVDVSGHGGFRLTPTGDPENPHVELTLTTLTQTSTTLRVRAKRAYWVD